MGVNDAACRRCGADIQSLPLSSAYCRTCYPIYRAEKDAEERQELEDAFQDFMDLPDDDKWERIYRRLWGDG